MTSADYAARDSAVLAPAAVGHRPAARDGLAGPYARFSLVSSLAELESLEADWRALEAACARSQGLFQCFDWCLAWSRVYAAGPGRHRIAVVCGYSGDRLVVVWPLMKDTSGGFAVLRWLSEPLGQYGDVLLAPGHDPRPWLRAAWSFLRRQRIAGTIALRHVRADAIVYPFLRETCRPATCDDAAPYMDLTRYPDEAAYEARYGKEQRRRRRRIHRDLEARGPVHFALLEPGSDMDAALEQALGQKHRWLKAKGLYSAALGCPRLLPFLRALSRAGDNEMGLVTSVLSAGGKAISWEVGLRYKGRHCGFITAHDTAFTDSSPARLHMDLSQRRAIADGMTLFDLMVPNDPHKESWSTGRMPVCDFYAPLSLSGFIYVRLYLEGVRLCLRHAYYRAPSRLRRLLTAAANAVNLLR